jgi:gliding motility-associated-like protein
MSRVLFKSCKRLSKEIDHESLNSMKFMLSYSSPSLIRGGMFICLVFMQTIALAQFQVNGSATQTSCNCYELTSNTSWQVGSVWNTNVISLNQAFDFEFEIFLGCNDGGADGLVFALQPVGTGIGTVGNGMGLGGVSPSLGVFFDSFQNVSPDNDPVEDHISLNSNGNVNHDGGVDDLLGPFITPNLEDCNWHDFRVVWSPSTTTLEAYLDGTLYITYVADIVNTLFAGNPTVYWGFTSATGNLNNQHLFCTALESDFAASTLSTCPGVPITFSDSSSSFGVITDYNWDFGDGNSGTGPNVSHSYSSNGSYDVVLTITDAIGCIDSYFITVTIESPQMNVSATPAVICPGESTQLEVVPITTSSYSYNWTPSNALDQASIANPTASPSSATYFSVTITDNATGCSNQDSVFVDILSLPDAVLDASTISGCSPLDVTFTNQSSGAVSYEWDFGNGNSFITTNTDIYTETFIQSSAVLMIAESSGGCLDSALVTITIPDCGCTDPSALNYNSLAVIDDGSCTYSTPSVVVPNVFSPNGDEINDLFFLNVTNVSEVHFTILNHWGNVMYEESGAQPIWDGTTNGEQAEEGTYFVTYVVTGTNGEEISGQGFVQLMK